MSQKYRIKAGGDVSIGDKTTIVGGDVIVGQTDIARAVIARLTTTDRSRRSSICLTIPRPCPRQMHARSKSASVPSSKKSHHLRVSASTYSA
jgi:NaMN:DMB phosphoribosyltransferase